MTNGPFLLLALVASAATAALRGAHAVPNPLRAAADTPSPAAMVDGNLEMLSRAGLAFHDGAPAALHRRATECKESCIARCNAKKTTAQQQACLPQCNQKAPCANAIPTAGTITATATAAAPVTTTTTVTTKPAASVPASTLVPATSKSTTTSAPAPQPTGTGGGGGGTAPPAGCTASTNGPPAGLPAVFPAAAGTRSCTAPINVAAGATFDGGMFRYDRGAGFRPPNDCLDAEAGAADTIFILADGATLQNVVIGQEVFDAVYCTGSCKLKNVWFERTCEDSWSLKNPTTCTTCTMSWTGGAISGFKDKGVQHNGAGTVFLSDIDAFWTTQGKGKLYRSCGGCGFPQRNVVMTNVRGHGVPGEALAGVNADKGDTATLSGVSLPAAFDGDFHVCEMFPTKVDGINNANCKYTDASITFA